MTDVETLAAAFEAHRERLVGVAHRMLGSAEEAEVAVQETWARLGRAPVAEIENLTGWLTTVVARVCLEALRSRGSRPEERRRGGHPGRAAVPEQAARPEHDAVLADAVGAALLLVLERLAPAERLSFVLLDLFAMPVDDVARVLGRTPTATGQLAGRARRQVQSPDRTLDAERVVQARVVEAFLTASAAGDREELEWLLHPDAVLHADTAAVSAGSTGEVHGAAEVAEAVASRVGAARPVLLDGFPAATRRVGGRPGVVLGFTVVDGRIAEIELLADPDVLAELDLGTGSEPA